jgi:small subunit ribosomal protein S17
MAQAKTTKKTTAPKSATPAAAKAPKAPPVAATASAITAKELAASGDPKMQGIRLHGKEFVGIVKSDRANKTVSVEWVRRRLVRKFERYEKRYSRVYAHNPEAISARQGDTVRVKESRPLSKTKNFVVIEVIKRAEETQ